MLLQIQDTFLEALQSYLETYKLQTATAAKLWAAVSSSTGEDVSTWMQPWTYRPGYPLLTVSLQGLDVLVTQVCPPCAQSRWTQVHGQAYGHVCVAVPG